MKAIPKEGRELVPSFSNTMTKEVTINTTLCVQEEGHRYGDVPAKVSDLRKAAKACGYALVATDQMDKSCFEALWLFSHRVVRAHSEIGAHCANNPEPIHTPQSFVKKVGELIESVRGVTYDRIGCDIPALQGCQCGSCCPSGAHVHKSGIGDFVYYAPGFHPASKYPGRAPVASESCGTQGESGYQGTK
jgi:hypothetical protein